MIPKNDHETNVVLTIEDASHCLPALADQVHASGHAALLLKSGRPFVRIVPFQTDAKVATDLIAFLRQWRIDHPDPDEQFGEAIEESRKPAESLQDPWE